ncbi:unnamed protein product [Gordionus sp. m RMFG-2023]
MFLNNDGTNESNLVVFMLLFLNFNLWKSPLITADQQKNLRHARSVGASNTVQILGGEGISALHFINKKIGQNSNYKTFDEILLPDSPSQVLLKRYKKKCVMSYPHTECRKLKEKIRLLFMNKLKTFMNEYLEKQSGNNVSSESVSKMLKKTQNILSSEEAFAKAQPKIHSLTLNVIKQKRKKTFTENVMDFNESSTDEATCSTKNDDEQTTGKILSEKYPIFMKVISGKINKNQRNIEKILAFLMSNKQTKPTTPYIPPITTCTTVENIPLKETPNFNVLVDEEKSMFQKLTKKLANKISKGIKKQNRNMEYLLKYILSFIRGEKMNDKVLLSLISKYQQYDVKMSKMLLAKIENMDKRIYYRSKSSSKFDKFKKDKLEKKMKELISKASEIDKKYKKNDKFVEEEDKLKLIFYEVTTKFDDDIGRKFDINIEKKFEPDIGREFDTDTGKRGGRFDQIMDEQKEIVASDISPSKSLEVENRVNSYNKRYKMFQDTLTKNNLNFNNKQNDNDLPTAKLNKPRKMAYSSKDLNALKNRSLIKDNTNSEFNDIINREMVINTSKRANDSPNGKNHYENDKINGSNGSRKSPDVIFWEKGDSNQKSFKKRLKDKLTMQRMIEPSLANQSAYSIMDLPYSSLVNNDHQEKALESTIQHSPKDNKLFDSSKKEKRYKTPKTHQFSGLFAEDTKLNDEK